MVAHGRPAPGTPCGLRLTKRDFTHGTAKRHWGYDGVIIGHDQHGTWFASQAGEAMRRSGKKVVATHAWVTCVPHAGMWVLRVQPPHPRGVELYVDVATVPAWLPPAPGEGPGRMLAVAADLDLDVVRRRSGRVVVEDEERFADHVVSLGYPDALVRAAQATCDELLEAVSSRQEPFGDVAQAWLDKALGKLVVPRPGSWLSRP